MEVQLNSPELAEGIECLAKNLDTWEVSERLSSTTLEVVLMLLQLYDDNSNHLGCSFW
jgi:glutamate/tyrosine decarboxylase-like PLP-dependent enzyme